MTVFLRENVARTFDEDKEILELQQQNLGDDERDPAYRVAVAADAGVLRAQAAGGPGGKGAAGPLTTAPTAVLAADCCARVARHL